MVKIRQAVSFDLPQIARIHKQQFKDHFLGQYSEEMIRRYYEPFLDSCIFLVSEINGDINGFAMGGMRSDLEAAKRKFLAHNKAKYVIETMFTPSVYIMALNRLKLLKSAPTDNVVSFRLLSIAILESAKGTGVATKLVQEFEKHVDTQEYGLSVHTNNNRAIRFYLKCGFKKTHEKEGNTFFFKGASSGVTE